MAQAPEKSETQPSNLHNIVAHTYKDKGVYRNLVQKKLELEKELENTCKEYNCALENEKQLLQARSAETELIFDKLMADMIQLNTSAANLQSTIKHLMEIDDLCKNMPEKVEQLKAAMCSVTKAIHNVQEKQKEYGFLEQKFAENEERHEKMLSDVKEQYEESAKNQREVFEKELSKKECEVQQLTEQLKELQIKHEEEIQNVKSECAQSMIRFKEECTTKSPVASMKTDIFRQKLLSLQSEHATEMTTLQRMIATLHLQMQQCPHCSMSAIYQKQFNEFFLSKTKNV